MWHSTAEVWRRIVSNSQQGRDAFSVPGRITDSMNDASQFTTCPPLSCLYQRVDFGEQFLLIGKHTPTFR